MTSIWSTISPRTNTCCSKNLCNQPPNSITINNTLQCYAGALYLKYSTQSLNVTCNTGEACYVNINHLF